MRKLFLKLVIFSVLCLFVDQALGVALEYLQKHAKSGNFLLDNHIYNDAKENVLIFGSSRANHHYVPQIIEDSLGQSCYNCGRDGNGIILAYGMLKAITSRYYPSIIILDNTYDFDLNINDNRKYLDYLRPYYNCIGNDSIFTDIDKTERVKMWSKTYRYNSKIFSLLKGNFLNGITLEENGYIPLYGTIKTHLPIDEERNLVNEVDSVKLEYLKKFIHETKGKVCLIVATSPSYGRTHSKEYSPIKELCKQNDIPFLDHFADTSFVFNKDYFKDSSHLNNKGAEKYTKSIIKEIQLTITKESKIIK